jgi:AcrR family transcriptional regulator
MGAEYAKVVVSVIEQERFTTFDSRSALVEGAVAVRRSPIGFKPTDQTTFRRAPMAEHKAPPTPRHRRPITSTEREERISGEPAQRMIVKTRMLIAQRGIAAANVREVAAACRVSAATPLWYFGSKGRLLIEVLRVEHLERLALLRSHLESAQSRDAVVDGLHQTLLTFLEQRQLRGSHELITEISRLALDDPDVATRRGEMSREYRDVLARLLGDKQQDGIVRLAGHSTSVAALLISLAQGLAVEASADRGWSPAEAIADARVVVQGLVQPTERQGAD